MPRVARFDEFGGPEKLTLRNEEVPAPGPDEVQVEMRAAGLNRAELSFIAGTYLVEAKLPNAAVGFEGAGVVRIAGDKVTAWSPGDRVAITPGFDQQRYGVIAEIVNVPASALERIPDSMSFTDAAAFWMSFATAYGLLITKGDLGNGVGSVAFNAASSSVGLSIIQLANSLGLKTIALTRGRAKVSELQAAGADHIVVTDEEDTPNRVLELTNGQGVDLVLDAVAGPGQAELAKCAGFEKRLIQYGGLSGELPNPPLEAMFGKGVSVSAFHVVWHLLNVPERRSQVSELLDKMHSDGAIQPVIDKVFGLGEISEAYSYMATNEQFGKIVLEFS